MGTFDIAHIREQGQDIIVVFVSNVLDGMPPHEVDAFTVAIQDAATSAGLAGTTVPVWKVGSGFKFISPTRLQPYFRSATWEFLVRNINRQLVVR